MTLSLHFRTCECDLTEFHGWNASRRISTTFDTVMHNLDAEDPI